MKTNKVLFSLILMTVCSWVSAQTDFTSRITNASFEDGMTGWTIKSMQTQNNAVFNIKQGSIYMEKWTGKGGAVGSASVSQSLTALEPGQYQLSAAAQNIQEDSPNAAQTGAFILAGDNQSAISIRNTYTVGFSFISGSVNIGFEAVNASGNWIAVDNFKLTKVSNDLSAELKAAIEHAVTTYADGTGKQSEQLLNAINAGREIATNGTATGQQQADAIIALQKAEDIYLRANASEEQPLDLTSLLVNPSFEQGDFTGWTQEQMSLQSNNVFNIKQGTYYAEKWTGKGGAVGDALLSQKVTGLSPGRYRLHAVAQNIQENSPQAAQTGAVIFAGNYTQPVTTRNQYKLDFVLVSDELEIGFRATKASGNWISADNFRLEYIGDSQDAIRTAFEQLFNEAQELLDKRMSATAHQDLQEAIDMAKPLLQQDNSEGWDVAARQLEAAKTTAESSAKIFAQLQDAITSARQELASSTASATTDFETAINAAQTIYDQDTTTDNQALETIVSLDKAVFTFRIDNGSGAIPTVQTDPRFIKGCTWAFGRSTVKGGNIIEEGFCWSEDPDPKVTDNRTTEYLNQAGKIYWLRDLKPGTMYYMRAYAITKDYAVGYGDVIKFSTVPKGTIGHWYNNGGDETVNDRINYAINLSMDYYWNNLTSIHGFGISVTYSPGTPTADCSYGGWMRVGANSSYQQPGTIMHEALHGIGVGTHGIWWSADMRADGNRGVWLGDRVTEAVRFWDNSPTATITGDDTHLWPYGCNGAHEDNHSDNLYCMMGILAQALNEDGLPGSGDIGYALPYYSFNHEDGVKYYIKNEDEKHGLRSAYLVETASHQLEWKAMDAEEAEANDAAAWYLTFTPSNQYYQFRNAASGYYITYSGGFKTVNRTNPTTADNLHLMRGRVDVDGHRGYYIIHPESNANPPTLTANNNGKTGSTGWNISKSATTQRWLILTTKEAENFDNGNIDLALSQLKKIIAQIRKLAETPHNEVAEGTDERLAQQLSTIEEQAKTCTKGNEVDKLTQQARAEGMAFLANVSAEDIDHPFDLSFMLENTDFDTDATSGWTSTNGAPGYDVKCAEFYERTFEFYQTLENMPKGVYQLRANAFQRPGRPEDVYAPYSSGKAKVTSSLFINSVSESICHACDDRQPSALFNDGGWGSDSQMGDGTYIPNSMTGASKYFANNLYVSTLETEMTADDNTLRLGIKCTSAPSYYWTIFDSFRLYFYGQNRTVVGIDDLKFDTKPKGADAIFDLSGRRILSGSSLKPGIYIVNGRKVLVK